MVWGIGPWLCRHGIHKWRLRETWTGDHTGKTYSESECVRCSIRGIKPH